MPLMVIGFVGLLLPAAVYLFFVVFVGALGLLTGGAGAVGIFALIAAFVGGGALAQYPLLVLIPLGVGAVALVGASWGSVRALRVLGIRSPRKTTWIAFAAGLAALSIISGAVSTMLIGIFGLFDGSAGQLFTAGTAGEDGGTFLAREISFYSIMLLVCVPMVCLRGQSSHGLQHVLFWHARAPSSKRMWLPSGQHMSGRGTSGHSTSGHGTSTSWRGGMPRTRSLRSRKGGPQTPRWHQHPANQMISGKHRRCVRDLRGGTTDW